MSNKDNMKSHLGAERAGSCWWADPKDPAPLGQRSTANEGRRLCPMTNVSVRTLREEEEEEEAHETKK